MTSVQSTSGLFAAPGPGLPEHRATFGPLPVADPVQLTAAAELTGKGYRLIHDPKTEPWGQITARLLSPEGLLVAVCYTPAFHEEAPN